MLPLFEFRLVRRQLNQQGNELCCWLLAQWLGWAGGFGCCCLNVSKSASTTTDHIIIYFVFFCFLFRFLLLNSFITNTKNNNYTRLMCICFFFLHLRFVFVSLFSHSKKFQVLVVFKHFNTTGRFIVGALHFEHKILNFQLFVLFTNKSRNLTTARPQKRGGKERTFVVERNLFTFTSKVFILFFSSEIV